MTGEAVQLPSATCLWLCTLVWMLGLASVAAPNTSQAQSTVGICHLIAKEARAHEVPEGCFARLIWQESRFGRLAVSPKGAQGIAQFMPTTAAERALHDPFDIPSALAESAALLAEHISRFGNCGLAAAAYNAGPQRVRQWLAGTAGLPLETRNYVRAITGREAEVWRLNRTDDPDIPLDPELTFVAACRRMASHGWVQPPNLAQVESPALEPPEPSQPWGVQLVSHASYETALEIYGRMAKRYAPLLANRRPIVVHHRAPSRTGKPLFAVRIGANSREAATRLCAALRLAGGVCWIIRH